MQIVDRIRKQLEQPDGLTPESLAPLAEEYSRVTIAANDRLSECVSLLRRGLRAEAIQRASMKPRLIELAAEIDFPELDEWIDILKFYGIQAPVLLNRDGAQQLQEAVVDEQPIEDLLRQHRRLAIAKAPLGWRLRILRRLAIIDSKNPVWREDQGQWEIIRLKQLPGEVAQAKAENSLDKVEELHRELQYPEWVYRPPRELISQVEEVFLRLQYTNHVKQLEQAANELHHGFSAGSEPETLAAYDKWNSILSVMTSPPPQSLVESAEPSIEWLQTQISNRIQVEDHQNACRRLEDSIERHVKLAELKQRYLDVLSFQLGVPPMLEQRYQTQSQLLQTAAKRKTFLLYSSAILLAIGVVASFGIWNFYSNRSSETAAAIAALTSLDQDGKYDELKKIADGYREAKKHFHDNPEIVRLASNATEKIKEEQDRAAKFQQDFEKLDSLAASELKANEVDALQGNAKLETEKQIVTQIVKKLKDYEQKLIDDWFADFTKRFAKLKEEVNEITDRDFDQPAFVQLGKLEIQINEEIQRFAKNSKSTDRRASELASSTLKRISSAKDAYVKKQEQLKREEGLLDDIKKARSLEVMVLALKEYSSAFGEKDISTEYRAALKNEEAWIAEKRWSELCEKFLKAGEDGWSAEEFKSMIDDLAKFDRKLFESKVCLQQTFRSELQNALAPIEARSPSLDKLRMKLVGEDALYRNLVTMRSSEGGKEFRRFFPHEDGLQQKVIIKIKKGVEFTRQFVVNDDGGVQSEPELVKLEHQVYFEPRSFLMQYGEKLAAANPDQWDRLFSDSIDSLSSAKDLDVRLKELILREIILAFSNGSPSIKTAYQSVLKKLNEAKEVGGWYKRAEFSSEWSDEFQKMILKAKSDHESDVKRRKGQFQAFLDRRHTWVGIINRDATGLNTQITSKVPSRDLSLFTLIQKGDDLTSYEFIELEVSQNGGVTPKRKDVEIIAGQPIYSRPKPPTKSPTKPPSGK